MKKFALVLTVLMLIFSAGQMHLTASSPAGRGCSGTADCTACKSCSGCKHCAKEGGTCGVCAPPKKAETPKKEKPVKKEKGKKEEKLINN